MEENEKEKISLADKILTGSPRNRMMITIIVGVSVFAIVSLAVWQGFSLQQFFQMKGQEAQIDVSEGEPQGPDLEARGKALDKGGGKVEQGKKIAVVGEETLYGRDLNYALLVYSPEVFDSDEDVSKDVLDAAIQRIVEESLILQEGAKRGYITLSKTIYNAEKKDYPQRNEAYTESLGKLRLAEESAIFFEALRVDFRFETYDEDKDDYVALTEKEVATYKALTKAKIEGVHAQVATGVLTLEAARQQLEEDVELSALVGEEGETVVTLSTYPAVTPDTPLFGPGNEDLKDAVWTLNQGEISDVFLGKELVEEGKTQESYWTFFVLNKKEIGASGTMSAWIKKARTAYGVTVL